MSDFKVVGRVADLDASGRLLADLDGRAIAVFRVDGEVFAIDDVCTHDGGPLADGEVIGCLIQCPRHGARFDIRTGKAVGFPAFEPVATHRVEVRDGAILVAED